MRQRSAIHAALHATVDAILESVDRPLPRAVLRELSPNAYERHGIWLGPALQMAVLAREIVASEASCWIRHLWPDLIRGIGEKRVPISNKVAKRIVRNSGDIRSRPLSEIDIVAPRDQTVKACYRARGAQHRREQKKPRAFHSPLKLSLVRRS
jgi:hypothetical protein